MSMKKFILGTILSLFLLLGIFSYVNAAWWNPTSWFKEEATSTQGNAPNDELLKKVDDLEKRMQEKETKTTQGEPTTPEVQENTSLKAQLVSVQGNYDSCKAQLTSTNIATTIIPPVSDHYNDYTYPSFISVHSYKNNPLPFFNKPVSISTASVSDFIPAIDPTKDSSYIEITDDTTASSNDKIMLKFSDPKVFNSLTTSLKKGDPIDVWGLGSRSEEFKTVGISSYTSNEPVLTPKRIDKCDPKTPNNTFITSDGITSPNCATGNTTYLWVQ